MESMAFYFVQDFRQNHRFFSSEPALEIQIEFSKLKKIWKTAREKLMLLPPRILRQEQAFEKILKIESEEISIHFAHGSNSRRIKLRFFFFYKNSGPSISYCWLSKPCLSPSVDCWPCCPVPMSFSDSWPCS